MHYNNLYLIREIVSNGYFPETLDFFSILVIFCGIVVIISKNPIISVLFLIGLFSGGLWLRKLLLCLQLPNSGDVLKLLILNVNRKIVREWVNISCIVISQKIIIVYFLPIELILKQKLQSKIFCIILKETSIDYRGSKSIVIDNKSTIVKEQRVKGSWQEKISRPLIEGCFSCLRCALMGFERNYQIRILSKQINKQRKILFSSNVVPQQVNLKLNPWWLTGFVDGEGCFSIDIIRDKRLKTGWPAKLRFSIGLHEKDKALLEYIQYYLGGDYVYMQGLDLAQFLT